MENMRLTLLRYRDEDCCTAPAEIELRKSNLQSVSGIPVLMELEGEARKAYYRCLDHVVVSGMELNGRSRNPPGNPANSLMSYGNALLYSSIITEIYHTRLDQTVSFLHEPHERRYSLSLDIAEIFKPLIVDRLLIGLANQSHITPSHFEKQGDACMLTDDGWATFLNAFDDCLLETKNIHRSDEIFRGDAGYARNVIESQNMSSISNRTLLRQPDNVQYNRIRREGAPNTDNL